MLRMDMGHQPAGDWRQAVATGELGLWDLRPELETVQHSPIWKQRLGFPEPQLSDSTHFWRCRVHPQDLQAMLAAMDEHTRGTQPTYEARFRLRSNGSGYRLVHSRGRIIERNDEGRTLRMVGTTIDLTERPFTPQAGLAGGPRGAMAGVPLAFPFHVLLADAAGADAARFTLEQAWVLDLVEDLLLASAAQLESQRLARM
jgi:hypothetical protein